MDLSRLDALHIPVALEIGILHSQWFTNSHFHFLIIVNSTLQQRVWVCQSNSDGEVEMGVRECLASARRRFLKRRSFLNWRQEGGWKGVRYVRETAGWTWKGYTVGTEIAVLDRIHEYKRNWIQRVNRMYRNWLSRIIKN